MHVWLIAMTGMIYITNAACSDSPNCLTRPTSLAPYGKGITQHQPNSRKSGADSCYANVESLCNGAY